MSKQLLSALLLASLASACTTIDNDPSVLYAATMYRTRIDFEPIKRETLDTQVRFEQQSFEEKEAPLSAELERVRAERQEYYAKIEPEFADCQHQKHCLAQLSRGSEARFERYNELTKKLYALDARAAELENTIHGLDRRRQLRQRALYNRYLVNEIVLAKFQHPRIRDVLVHSLEAYPSKRELAYRLANAADPNVVPTLYGDLNFKMMGEPIDEAAVVATFDVRVAPTEQANDPTRYLVTFLVNTHQLDSVAYPKGFLRTWANRLGEPGLQTLKEETFCGLYSIASPMFVDRLAQGKVKPCGPARLKNQEARRELYLDRSDPGSWILPIGFTDASKER